MYVVKQKCTNGTSIKFGVLVRIINKKVYLHNDNKKNFPVSSQHGSSEFLLKDIRRNTKRIFTSEQKVLIVMEGNRGEQSIAELCRKYSISSGKYSLKGSPCRFGS